jgi:hypothetical protein
MTPPTGEVWVQFPLVAVIVACFILAFTGIFFITRWIWGEYKQERDKDLAWRADQNEKREAAIAFQNNVWREAITSRDARYEQYDKERQTTLSQVATSMASLAHQLEDHDAQAKQIMSITERIDDNTRPVERSRRKPAA